ncbi:dethiobiotin synthase [Helicobacter cynogastricus]|uniref:dethiobiotin synthase n=1 Tax=Helicobacter cynogastricus TaxID=329937 RepID=UPI000CF0DDAB|nr:dethiobiotin synthase [Helicobacter cynogastricus]
MYAPIFVSATNTGVGKTTLSLEIARLCKARGIETLLVKPIETGINAEAKSDAQLFLEENLNSHGGLKLEDISFYRYVLAASPFVATRFEPHIVIDFKEIKKNLDNLQERCDLLIIEGVGGLLTPLDSKNKIIDLSTFLKAKLLLIVPDRLGMLNNLLLNQEYCNAHKIPAHFLINVQDKRTYAQICKPYIDHLNPTLKIPILEFPEQGARFLDSVLVPC